MRISEETSGLESAGSASGAINAGKCSPARVNSANVIMAGQFVSSAIVSATSTAGSLPLAIKHGDGYSNAEDAENDLSPSPFCGALCPSKVAAMVAGKRQTNLVRPPPSMTRSDAMGVSVSSTNNDCTLLKYLRAVISSR